MVALPLVGAGVPFAWAEEKIVTLATGDDYPPFTDTELNGGGIAVQLVMRSFELAGYYVETLNWHSWERGYKLTRDGEYDGTFPYLYTEEREDHFLYSAPFLGTRAYAGIV